jgi:hypothetical protein
MKKKKAKAIPARTLRVKTKNLGVYIRKNNSWKKTRRAFPEAMHVIELFKAHDNFGVLIDAKKPEFLKGQLSPDGRTQGARVNVLPDNIFVSLYS